MQKLLKSVLILGITIFSACNEERSNTEKAIENAENLTVDSLESKNDSLTRIMDSVSAGRKAASAADPLKK